MFYDGSYFSIVSNYYMYHHEKKARLSISGLHKFVRSMIAKEEELDEKYVRVVDSHYFRGRFSAQQVSERDMLFKERIWDDTLIKEGVITHYLPMGPEGEKGVDVNLALECYDLAKLKSLDVVCLVAGDSDYIPLVRKLNTLGVNVMVLGWSFTYEADNGEERGTRVSQLLMNEVTYPMDMTDLIEGMDGLPVEEREAFSDLFVRRRGAQRPEVAQAGEEAAGEEAQAREWVSKDGWKAGTIVTLSDGYGFITPADGADNLFFHHSALDSGEFADLFKGQEVSYQEGLGTRGTMVALHVRTYY